MQDNLKHNIMQLENFTQTWSRGDVIKNYGKSILRKKSSGEWVKTFLNQTYAGLILEFPEDYILME